MSGCGLAVAMDPCQLKEKGRKRTVLAAEIVADRSIQPANLPLIEATIPVTIMVMVTIVVTVAIAITTKSFVWVVPPCVVAAGEGFAIFAALRSAIVTELIAIAHIRLPTVFVVFLRTIQPIVKGTALQVARVLPGRCVPSARPLLIVAGTRLVVATRGRWWTLRN